jgi:CBS domain-containing protein/gamma-glutamylcysteine synthetase
MGDFNVRLANSEEEIKNFTKHLLKDVQAFEKMLEEGRFEKGVYKIGAEQEFCLVDQNYKPFPINLEILEEAKMDNLSPELAKFNLETNASPQEFTGNSISKMEKEILDDLEKIRKIVNNKGGDIILTGILPTIRKFDIGRDNITPFERYYALMDALKAMRGEEFLINIYGIDELNIKLDSGVIEAANTGFQVHLQVDADSFVKKYNIAQAIAGPVLATAVNAPLLFGKRLWRETRIALFQQAIDTRVSTEHIREHHPRVTFGTNWVKNSVMDLFKEDILRYRVLLGADINEDSLEIVKQGGTPSLKALTVHNSTIYRWNRPVYGISSNGKPHLRIEARMFPAGPTVVDEMANTAFWLGLMEGYCRSLDDITKLMKFDDAKDNFYAAARSGMTKHFTWFNKKRYSLKELVLEELLPVAREGLEARSIDKKDIDKYLNIIEERVKKGQNGSSWMLDTYKEFQDTASKEETLALITESAIENQKEEKPVHTWKIPDLDELPHWRPSDLLVEEVMQTDILSVQPNDILEFVADMMDWAKLRYVPVEDKNGDFAGLVTSRKLLRTLRSMNQDKGMKDLKVKDIMITNPLIIEPDKKVEEAMEIMDQNKIGSLPVIQNNKLIGMLTETDFFHLSKRLFKRFK